jgi:hypothetical protein
MEPLEDPLLIAGRDTHAAVLDLDGQLAAAPSGPHVDPLLVTRVLDRVAQ